MERHHGYCTVEQAGLGHLDCHAAGWTVICSFDRTDIRDQSNLHVILKEMEDLYGVAAATCLDHGGRAHLIVDPHDEEAIEGCKRLYDEMVASIMLDDGDYWDRLFEAVLRLWQGWPLHRRLELVEHNDLPTELALDDTPKNDVLLRDLENWVSEGST